MVIKPNPHLASIHRDEESMAKDPTLIYLDRNERFGGFPEDVIDEMRSIIGSADLCLYPDTEPLMERLCCSLGVERACVQITSGADGAVRRMMQAFVSPGQAVALTMPSWAMLSIYAGMFQGRIVEIIYENNLTLDLEKIRAALADKPTLLAFASPNQPTGTTHTLDELAQVAALAQDAGTVMLVDETYYPFTPVTAASLIGEFDNLGIIRSFSKAAGMPGLRLGYLLGHPNVMQHTAKVRGSYDVSSIALAFGCYVLDHPEFVDRLIEEIEESRKIVKAVADRFQVRTPPCPANFQLLQLPPHMVSSHVVTALRAKGYVVKGGYSHPAMVNSIRVTLDNPQIIRGFIAALAAVLEEMTN